MGTQRLFGPVGGVYLYGFTFAAVETLCGSSCRTCECSARGPLQVAFFFFLLQAGTFELGSAGHMWTEKSAVARLTLLVNLVNRDTGTARTP